MKLISSQWKMWFQIFLLALFAVCSNLPISAQNENKDDYEWRDSNQRKYALLVGINKYTYINPLKGCSNDIQKMASLLKTQFGLSDDNLQTLIDGQATREAIKNQIKSFSEKVKRGDLFIFIYSGHGSLFPDSKSEDKDEKIAITPICLPPGDCLKTGYYDSTILPVDAGGRSTSGKPWENEILDDELYQWFSEFTRKGCMVVVISDSCHSGTLARSGITDDLMRFVSPEVALSTTYSNIPEPTVSREIESRDMQGLYLVITSAKDDQVSWEYRDDLGEHCGLFTYVFRKVIQNRSNKATMITYRELINAIQPEVAQLSRRKNTEQNPQIDTRYYSGSLDIPLFSLPRDLQVVQPPPQETSLLEVEVFITDLNKQPISGCTFGVLKEGASGNKGETKDTDILVYGKSNERGVILGVGSVAPGRYLVKVVRPGYKTITRVENIYQNMPGKAIMIFRLERE